MSNGKKSKEIPQNITYVGEKLIYSKLVTSEVPRYVSLLFKAWGFTHLELLPSCFIQFLKQKKHIGKEAVVKGKFEQKNR